MPNQALLVIGIMAVLPAADLDEADLAARIAALRQVDAEIVLPAGATGPVQYALRRHAFPFGTALNASLLGVASIGKDGTPRPLPPAADQQRYQELVDRHFSAGVAENEMKWYHMEPADGVARDEAGLGMIAWCEARGIALRGHCLFWGIEKYVQDWVKALPDDQLAARMRARLTHVTGLYRGRIAEWDLNNEMMHGDHYAKRLGYRDGAEYFRWAVAADPTVRWFVNDYGVLQSNQVASAKRYVTHIRALQASGARVDGIGDQAHYSNPLPENRVIWEILDQLGSLGLPVLITEYDQAWKGMAEDEQAAALRRFVSICFAHPAVRGIYLWGFWEGRHWRKGCGLWREDWTIKPNGQAWVDLMTRDWHTSGEMPATNGRLRFRGFPGTYRLTWPDGAGEARVVDASPATVVTVPP
jgi:GH35 family endo-1,4-beta-xylanase